MSVKFILTILSVIVIWLFVYNLIQVNQIKQLQRQVKALDAENRGQWQRISEFELMLCNPELIKCGK